MCARVHVYVSVCVCACYSFLSMPLCNRVIPTMSYILFSSDLLDKISFLAGVVSV